MDYRFTGRKPKRNAYVKFRAEKEIYTEFAEKCRQKNFFIQDVFNQFMEQFISNEKTEADLFPPTITQYKPGSLERVK